jgi:hypothetical protein
MIEATDILTYLSLAFSTLLTYLWKEERTRVNVVYDHYQSSKNDHKDIEDIKSKSNQAYLEYALSNQKLALTITDLDKDFRHGMANLSNVVNGFGARLTAIEEDVHDRMKENERLAERLSAVEKALFKN